MRARARAQKKDITVVAASSRYCLVAVRAKTRFVGTSRQSDTVRVDDGALPARRRRESDERVRSRGRVEFTDAIGPPFQVIERLKLNMTSSTRTGTYSEGQHSTVDFPNCLRFILIRLTAVNG